MWKFINKSIWGCIFLYLNVLFGTKRRSSNCCGRGPEFTSQNPQDQLLAICSSGSSGSNHLLWLVWAPAFACTHSHICAHVWTRMIDTPAILNYKFCLDSWLTLFLSCAFLACDLEGKKFSTYVVEVIDACPCLLIFLLMRIELPMIPISDSLSLSGSLIVVSDEFSPRSSWLIWLNLSILLELWND